MFVSFPRNERRARLAKRIATCVSPLCAFFVALPPRLVRLRHPVESVSLLSRHAPSHALPLLWPGHGFALRHSRFIAGWRAPFGRGGTMALRVLFCTKPSLYFVVCAQSKSSWCACLLYGCNDAVALPLSGPVMPKRRQF